MNEDDQDFIRMVCYFWLQKGDAERYSGWDAARCERLMPEFYLAWKNATAYGNLANMAAREAERRLPE